MQLETSLTPSIGDAANCAICVSESGRALGIASKDYVAAYLRYGQSRHLMYRFVKAERERGEAMKEKNRIVNRKKRCWVFPVERQEEEGQQVRMDTRMELFL